MLYNPKFLVNDIGIITLLKLGTIPPFSEMIHTHVQTRM